MISVLGIRHHGPGSARSVRAELDRIGPDAVLIEGPADASALIPLALDRAMRPPVALLVYAPDEPRTATFYPFAAFSPEWVAMRWGLEHGATVRFIDLAAGVQLAATRDALGRSAADGPTSGRERGDRHDGADGHDGGDGHLPDHRTIAAGMRTDPLDELARAAGEEDGERLWDRLVESRRTPGDVFEAVAEAMAAVRAALPETETLTLQREAAMRRGIRAAAREGFADIAVVCGAWHAPALASFPPAAADSRLLKALPRPLKTAAAWVPWTYDRLAVRSGYGAGIESPGWYEHLWLGTEPLAVSWMARVADVFRAERLDASPAHLVEATRLAEALAAMRGRSIPSLAELTEAVRACIAFGSDLPLELVRDRLIVGHVMGETPPNAPVAPLVADLEGETRRLRLKRQTARLSLDLDLRSETGLARSHLLHRLGMLSIDWGHPSEAYGKSGTFHELWTLAWRPELVVDLIAASRYGNTIAEAATAHALEAALAANDLAGLTTLIEQVLLADLRDAVDAVVSRIGDVAAIGADVASLMDALPPLARVLRYGNVRGTDASSVAGVVDGLVTRICVGLATAAASLDDDAAELFGRRVDGVHGAIALLDDPEDRAAWRGALAGLVDRDGLHGLVAGRACRILLDDRTITSADATRRMLLALSPGAVPGSGARWVEGFLRDSGTILLHDAALFAALDGWVTGLPQETFETVLPLLRRTVATFPPPERRRIGERLKAGPRRGTVGAADGIDEARADLVLPIVARILGIGGSPT